MTTMSNGDPLVGHVLDGRYEILSKLARGGMATVYLATDRRLTRTVAVKVMHDSYGGDHEFVTRFDREARAAAGLSHPNVVSVFDQGMDEGRPYIVMEYVQGVTLRHLITREAPMDPRRALDLLLPVVSAVAHAHEAGIIHRDLKPENVLISDRGQIKVADFGLARTVNAHTASATGMLIGTVSYIAPELVTQSKADTRCDVYALGVVLYEMLTGRKPHTGDTPLQIAYSHVHNEIGPPSAEVNGSRRDPRTTIPAYLDALVTTAAARNPAQRPVDGRVLHDHLRRAREALQHGVVDDPALTERMRATALEADAQVTEQLPLTASAPVPEPAVQKTATLRFTPSTPISPSQPPVADGMPYYDGPPPASPPLSPAAVPLEQRMARRRRRGVVTLVLVLLLALGLGGGVWWLAAGRFTETPELTSLTQSKAEALAAEAGLAVAFENEYSEDVTAGQVIRTQPTAGERIVHGGTITAFLSLGPERYPVPSLVGKTVDQATQALTEGHLAVGKVSEVYDDNVAIGRVVSTSIEAGKRVKPNTEVDLRVSKGPAPVEVVDYTGKQFADAKKYFEAEGVVVVVEDEVNDADVAKGAVISQTPTEGTLAKGETVRFVVSLGPVLVKVPGVNGMNVRNATKEMEKAGFKVKVEYVSRLLNLVAYSRPAEGEMAPAGSTITIYVL